MANDWIALDSGGTNCILCNTTLKSYWMDSEILTQRYVNSYWTVAVTINLETFVIKHNLLVNFQLIQINKNWNINTLDN